MKLLLITVLCLFIAVPLRGADDEIYALLCQALPLFKKNQDICEKFIRAEADLYSKTEMEARIKEAKISHDQSVDQMPALDKMAVYATLFTIQLDRTFREDSQDELASFTIAAVKEFEEIKSKDLEDDYDLWGWSIRYDWITNDDNTRSLWCAVEVEPESIMKLYEESQCALQQQVCD